MPYLPKMKKNIIKTCRKLELKSYAKRNIIFKGNEKTQEEVIYNSIINYLEKNNISPEDQLKYLKEYQLYLYDENNKNNGTNYIFYGLSTAGLVASIYYFSNNDKLTYAASFLTVLFIVVNGVVNKLKPNLYIENSSWTTEENEFLEDLLLEDKMIRKSIKYNDHAKALIK